MNESRERNTDMKKILIVEDEKLLNEAYATILTKEKYEVRSAYDGLEALNAFEEFNPDLILLDLRMPNMDGVSFLKQLKPERFPKLKIIVFSNYDAQPEIDEAFKYGATRYMLKAYASPNELGRLVKDTLTGKPEKKR
jgi:two-component system, OmpR family, response regulator VicR